MKISVVCPFYNEELILDKAIERMLQNLKALSYDWELIIVNDGSIDASLAIAKKWEKQEPKLRIIGYKVNQGRGYALKAGIDAAQGDIIITTEIDLSWGDDIVQKLANELIKNPKIDFVIASPNIPGGGYKNVPSKRVTISRLGNKIIGLLFSGRFTMNTGMTRAYRRQIIQNLKTREKGKEFHLEVLLKLTSLGFKSSEIPAVLEWKDHKLAKDKKLKRKSSSKISQLIWTHLHFAVLANPMRYFWGISFICTSVGITFSIISIIRFFSDHIAIYFLLTGLLLMLFGLLFFSFGIITAQNRYIMEEIWLNKFNKSPKSE